MNIEESIVTSAQLIELSSFLAEMGEYTKMIENNLHFNHKQKNVENSLINFITTIDEIIHNIIPKLKNYTNLEKFQGLFLRTRQFVQTLVDLSDNLIRISKVSKWQKKKRTDKSLNELVKFIELMIVDGTEDIKILYRRIVTEDDSSYYVE